MAETKKKQISNQLSRIEEILRQLSREVWKVQVTRKRVADGEEIDEDLNDDTAIKNRPALSRALRKAAKKQK
ncbi:MAG: hypothetical protein K0S45_3440 [Nitrospira sp.]|jgi:hypothetical protein|nr:hypothetical protein [Nitrospira sp.]